MSEDDDVTERAKARVGTMLHDKWRIDAILGSGGMATVYAATHRNQKRVAIKMLHPELSAEPTVRARFLREGYVANTVEHRGAVQVDDEGVTEDGAAFLVMELLKGETLDARRHRMGGALSSTDVLSLVDQLLDALAAAHDKGVIHRDLKPENLFLTQDGVVKVLDFGIARLRDGGEGKDQRAATRVGAIMGTPAFMAPEQARGRWDLVDARTDLWAVGATMFTLLSGRFVREAETLNEELALAITAPAPSIAAVVPALHPSMVALIDRALAYEREARWPDACTMQVAVREAYADLQAPGDEAPPPPRAPRTSMVSSSEAEAGTRASTLTNAAGSATVAEPPPRGSRRLALAAGGLVAVAALIAGGVKLFTGSPVPSPTVTSAAVSAPASAEPPAATSAAEPTPPSPSQTAAASAEAPEPEASSAPASSAKADAPRSTATASPRARPPKHDPFSHRR